MENVKIVALKESVLEDNDRDALPYFDFDLEMAKARILALNPRALFFPISAKTGESWTPCAIGS